MKILGRILRAVTAAAMAFSLSAAMPAFQSAEVSAATDYYRFDFGGGGVENGYTGVSASDGYNASKGYGFAQTNNMKNVAASGNGALSDAVQFVTSGANSQNTFNVNLDKGLYQVSVWLGNTMRTSVAAEGMYQLINLTGNGAWNTFQIPVTDGQLNINCTAGKDGYAYTLSALEIKKISSDTTMKQTIWLCGDSTVCDYYPLDSSVQAGWGQMLNKYVDTDKYEIRNLASGGQYAKGFRDYGQFTPIETYGKEGDIYIISIGINDTNYSNATEYREVVKDMSERAMKKGMKVILVKQQGRNGDAQRNPLLTGRWFGGELDSVGNELGLQVIDLFNLYQNYCIEIGANATTALYMDGDGLHPNRNGAAKLAELVASEIDFSGSVIEPPPVYKAGDLDNDGMITIIDCCIMKKGLLYGFGDVSVKNAADVDGNGSANQGDLLTLRSIVHNTGAAIAPINNFYYAIDAAYADYGISETTNAGYTGSAYVNLNNATGSEITFTVDAPQSGNYFCSFNIANGSANDRAMMITVNGGTDSWLQPFLTTNAWTTWEERGIVLPLVAGKNTIKLVSNTAEGGPNLDYLRIMLTDEPIAEIYTPGGGESPVVSDKPTVFIASDSTAQTYRESYAPQQGWGYYLGDFFTDNVTVANHAIAGRSSKSFYDNGRLTTILDAMKAGDFLIVSFGINDGASSKVERYAPVCGSVENATVGSFEYYLKFYIEGTIAKGGTPILASPTLSIKNQKQPFGAGYRNIDSAMKMLAAYYKIPYYDLQSGMANKFNSMDYNTVYNYYMGSTTDGGTDFTHFTDTGAKAVAQILANGIKELNCSLSGFVK